MKRFFVEGLRTLDKTVIITGQEFHHLKNVLRLKKGDEVNLFDGKGLEVSGRIEAIDRNEAHVTIIKRIEDLRENPRGIVLAVGLTKGEKIDLVIQKATELGVSKIIPFITERAVPKFEAAQIIKKTERWQRIAVEAAKQCKRAIIPEVEKPLPFVDVIQGWEGYLKIIPYEGEKQKGLKDVLSHKEKGYVLLIGPEGGFSESEIVEAKKANFIPVTLGPRILRAETAAISMVAILQYEVGDMGETQR